MKKSSFLLYVAAFILLPGVARADPTVVEVQPLSFGELVVTGNTVQSTVIETDGDQTHDPGFIPLLPGRNGIYVISGLDPATSINVTVVDPGNITVSFAGNVFDITNFTFDPALVDQVTDGSGQMTLYLGGTMSTRAGTSYSEGPYRGTFSLSVNY